MPKQREAAIVGIFEHPLRVVGPDTNAAQIKAVCAAKALEDAGFTWKDVDGIFDSGDGPTGGGLGISEYNTGNIVSVFEYRIL